MKTFFGSVALITAFAVLTRGMGFLFRIILSRVLGAELLGIYQIAFSFFMVFLTVIASGLPLVISRQISSGKGNHKALVRSGLIISLALSILIIFLVFFGQPLLKSLLTDDRSYTILIALVPAIFAFSIYTVLRAVWWGEKRYFLLGASELAEQLVRVVLFFIFLTFSSLFADLAVLTAVAFTVACIVSAVLVVVLYVKTKNNPSKIQSRDSNIATVLRTSSPVTIVRVLTVIAFPIIAVVVPLRLVAAGWDSTNAVAHFGIAVGMALPLLSIPQTVISSIAVALVPELSKANSNRDYTAVTKKISSCIKLTLLVNLTLLPLFIALGPGIGMFLFNNVTAGEYLRQSAWIMIPMSLSLLTNAILNSLGRETRAMVHYVIGSIFLFLSIWFLPQFIGIGSLIVGIGICMSLSALLNIGTIVKVTKSNFDIAQTLFKYAFAGLMIGIASWILFGWLGFVPLFFRLGFSSLPALAMVLFIDKSMLKRRSG